MGVELGIVMTLVHTSHLQHVLIQEVLHGFLHPGAHSNSFFLKVGRVAGADSETEQGELNNSLGRPC